MRGIRLWTVAFLAALTLGCVDNPTAPTPPTEVSVDVTQNVNIGQIPGGASPSPAPGTCGPVTEVTNGLLGAGGVKNATIRVNQSIPLDVTPNKNRDEHCNSFRRVAWQITQASLVCRLDNAESYTPNLTGVAVGTCVVRASVENVTANEPITVTVNPNGSLTFSDADAFDWLYTGPGRTTCHTCQ